MGTDNQAPNNDSENVQQQSTDGVDHRTEYSSPVRHHNHIIPILIGLFIFVVVVGGGLAYAYSLGYLHFLFGPPFGPETIVSETVAALSKIETGQFGAQLEVETAPRDSDVYAFPDELQNQLEDIGESPYSFSHSELALMTNMIPSDFSFALGFASSFNLSDTVSRGGESQLTAELDLEDLTMNSDIEFKVDGLETLYVRVNRYPSLFFDIGEAKGEWIAITLEELSRLGVVPDQGNDSYSFLHEETEQLLGIATEMVELLEKHKLYTAPEKPEQVEIDGERLSKYKLQLNAENMQAFFEDMKTLHESNMDLLGEFPYTDEEIAIYSKQAYADYYNVHAPWFVYVSSEGEVRQISVEGRLVFDGVDTEVLAGQQINFDLTVRFDNINEPVTIDIPSDALSLQELAEINPAVQAMLDSIQASIRYEDEYPVDDIDYGLSLYYDSSSTYPNSLEELTRELNTEFDQEGTVLYTSVNDGAGYVTCNEYRTSGDYYCATDLFAGEVPLDEIGSSTDALADMYDTIQEGLNTGAFMDVEQRNEMRRDLVWQIDSSFLSYSDEDGDYEAAWNAYRESDQFNPDYIPDYIEIEFTTKTSDFGYDDYEICSPLELSENKWCIDGTSFSVYEVNPAGEVIQSEQDYLYW